MFLIHQQYSNLILDSKEVEYVPRLLDIPEGKLCLVVGTVYMDMPLKPNILRELTDQVKFHAS